MRNIFIATAFFSIILTGCSESRLTRINAVIENNKAVAERNKREIERLQQEKKTTDSLKKALDFYKEVKFSIKLGDRRKNVVPKLNQVAKILSSHLGKDAEQYMKNGVKIEIHYVRSGWVRDGLTTDDEFTPYIFNNGILVAIGWTTLGGPKSISKK